MTEKRADAVIFPYSANAAKTDPKKAVQWSHKRCISPGNFFLLPLLLVLFLIFTITVTITISITTAVAGMSKIRSDVYKFLPVTAIAGAIFNF